MGPVVCTEPVLDAWGAICRFVYEAMMSGHALASARNDASIASANMTLPPSESSEPMGRQFMFRRNLGRGGGALGGRRLMQPRRAPPPPVMATTDAPPMHAEDRRKRVVLQPSTSDPDFPDVALKEPMPAAVRRVSSTESTEQAQQAAAAAAAAAVRIGGCPVLHDTA